MPAMNISLYLPWFSAGAVRLYPLDRFILSSPSVQDLIAVHRGSDVQKFEAQVICVVGDRQLLC